MVGEEQRNVTSDKVVQNCCVCEHSDDDDDDRQEGQRRRRRRRRGHCSCPVHLSDDDAAADQLMTTSQTTLQKLGQQQILSLPSTNVERDSGTESDEELEMIETNSMASFAYSQTSDCYASHPSWSMSSCQSPQCHHLFSDPDSNGCDPSAQQQTTAVIQVVAAAVNNGVEEEEEEEQMCAEPPELPAHHYHTRQQLQRLKEQHNAAAAAADVLPPCVDHTMGAKTAFVSLKRCRQQLQCVVVVDDGSSCSSASSSSSQWPQVQQHRLAPVRLLIPPAPVSEDEERPEGDEEEEDEDGPTSDQQECVVSLSPRKKSRHSSLLPKAGGSDPDASNRPCLNFEKMQQKLVKPFRKKMMTKRESLKAKVKLRAWSDGYQLRSCGSSFLFRPLEPTVAAAADGGGDIQPPVDSDNINDLVRNKCHL